MTAFVDAHRDRVSAGLNWGVEPICEVLQIAPSTFYARKSRPPSARTTVSSGGTIAENDIAHLVAANLP